MKKWFSYFLDNFGKHWVTFYSIIWSHCPPPIHTQLRWPNCWDIVAPFNLCKKVWKAKELKDTFSFFSTSIWIPLSSTFLNTSNPSALSLSLSLSFSYTLDNVQKQNKTFNVQSISISYTGVATTYQPRWGFNIFNCTTYLGNSMLMFN